MHLMMNIMIKLTVCLTYTYGNIGEYIHACDDELDDDDDDDESTMMMDMMMIIIIHLPDDDCYKKSGWCE